MNFFSAVAADLVEKRLWPVAAVLGAGAVAAPVAAHLTAPQPATSSSPSPALALPASHPHPADPSAVKTLIAQMNPNAGVVPLRQGGFHDPFASGASSSTAGGSSTSAAGGSKTSGVAPGGPATSTAGSGPSSLGPSVPVSPVRVTPPVQVSKPVKITPVVPVAPTHPTTPTSTSPTHPGSSTQPASSAPTSSPAQPHPNTSPHRSAPSHDSMKVYTATLRFGQAASAVTINNPLRLSPLPSKADPEVVYLGVMKDGKRAAFLVPKTAVATGDGSCRPSPTHCEIVVLHPGETEFLDILTPTAGLVQYELDLVSISHHRSATQAEAASTHRRESQDGRAVLRNSNSTALLALSFSPSLGLVYERPKKSASSTSGTQTSATRELPAPATPPAHSPATPPAAPSTPAPSPAVTPAAANPPASGSTPHSGS